MDSLWQDVHYAIRRLVRSPGVTTVVVVTLALGIGASVAVFSLLNGVLLRALPYPFPEQLVVLGETNPDVSSAAVKVSYPNLTDWQKESGIFQHLAAYRERSWILTGGDEPKRVSVLTVSPTFFSLLGSNAALGRTLLPGQDDTQSARGVILSYGFWQNNFGARKDILGNKVTLEGSPYTIVGVMPPTFHFIYKTDVWTLLNVSSSLEQMRGARFLRVVGRIKPGISLAQARERMNGLAQQLADAYSDTNSGWGVRLWPLQEELVGQFRQRLLLLCGAVGLLLLIACTNTTNLLLAHAAADERQSAIQLALGAGRGRLVRQFLIRSVLLGLMGGSLGLLLASWTMPLLLALSAGQIPRMDTFELDLALWIFAVGISLLASVFVGVIPAFKISPSQLNRVLREGGSQEMIGSRWLRWNRLRGLIICSEIAIAQVLLIGAILLGKSFNNLVGVDPGFRTSNLLCMQVSLPINKYAQDHQRATFFMELLERVNHVPNVRSAALTNALPLTGIDFKNSFTVEGRQVAEPQWSSIRTVSPEYFHTLGIPLLKGRMFSVHDSANSARTAVINEAMARRFWPNQDPIGKRILFDVPYTVVGVVGNVKKARLDASEDILIYLPFLQDPQPSMIVTVRHDSESTALAGALRAQVYGIDRNQPVDAIFSMADVMSRSVAQPRFSAIVLGVFAVVALVLALSGVYAVLSYSVSQRTHEIGIRMALGAQVSDTVKLVVRQGMILVLIGTWSGVAAAVVLSDLISSFLFGVSPFDPVTLVGTALLLVVVAFVGCFIPANRAAKVDPIEALRFE